MENGLLKKAIAECLGTFVLVFFACGVAALTGGNLVPTALAFGLVIVAMAYSVGRISGCHINPAVSLAMLVAKKMTVKEFVVYVCAQIVGGLLGAILLFGIAKMSNLALAGNACNGMIAYAGGDWNVGQIIGTILTEVVLTFIFIYVILNVTAKDNAAGKKGGLIIGLTLTLVHLVGIPLTGTSVNPARSIATAVADAIFNGTTDALAQVFLFIIAPLLGGLVAALVFKLLHKEEASAE